MQPSLNPNLRKQRSPSYYEIEIYLKEPYAAIASKVEQLFTDYTLQVLNATIQSNDPNTTSPKNMSCFQNKTQGFGDNALVFLSTSKKEVALWAKKLNTRLRLLGSQRGKSDGAYDSDMQHMNIDLPSKPSEEEEKLSLRMFCNEFPSLLKERLPELPEEEAERLAQVIIAMTNDEVVETTDFKATPEFVEAVTDIMSTYGIKPNEPCCRFLGIQEAPKSLYERLGGEAVIQAIVTGMYDYIFEDPEVNHFFEKTDR